MVFISFQFTFSIPIFFYTNNVKDTIKVLQKEKQMDLLKLRMSGFLLLFCLYFTDHIIVGGVSLACHVTKRRGIQGTHIGHTHTSGEYGQYEPPS